MRAFVLRTLPIITSLVFLQVTAEESSFTKDWPNEPAFINGIELSTEKFLTAYESENAADRRYAEVYLLGVLEATEGVTWCSYRLFKTSTLAETIFPALRKIADSEKQQRAAKVISSILERRYPCKGARK